MSSKTQIKKRKRLTSPVAWTGIIAALLYSSWPLGYWLNPSVASDAFASQLQAPNEAFNWLFILFDLLSGFAVMAAGVVQWQRAKGWLLRLGILAYSLFGALVIVAAVVPFDCDSLSTNCIYTPHSSLLLVHGLASILSVVSLLASMLILIQLLIRARAWKLLVIVASSIVVLWIPSGLLAMHFYHTAEENLVQYAFITVCSLSVAMSIILFEYLSRRKV